MKQLDAWIAAQPEPQPTRPEAVRAALRDWLGERIGSDDGPKVCPECQHIFQGNGWDGIDAHWRSKHEGTMLYAEAWPLIRDGTYKPK